MADPPSPPSAFDTRPESRDHGEQFLRVAEQLLACAVWKTPGVMIETFRPSRSESSFSALMSSKKPTRALGSNSASILIRRSDPRGNFASLRILCLVQNSRNLRFDKTAAVVLGGII
jgi:hypothetical protein